ncbi:MAG: S1 RNA-binding domain-containing protein [Actinomycetota bacterium]|nr:S1 RNA-binding domain-containing protein [Actinomycetota bacterium]
MVVAKAKIGARTIPNHVVVDGSNLATEGRSTPSLTQLNEAVLAFMQEFPKTQVTVVVDASFGHRIDKKEASEFSEAIANGELVTPPAGAVGRGDGFVLMIADKVNATIVSNDSYQEFHDQYTWLFDNGRLIGGKPVPHVGWVFVDRLPVRVKSESSPRRGVPNKTAPIPRPAARSAGRQAERPSARPAPRPTARPPTRPLPRPPSRQLPRPTAARANAAPSAVNTVEQYEAFATKFPVGTKVKGVVESFASHGAYVRIGDVAGYLPVRLMAAPAPRTPREHVKIGEQLSLVVSDFTQSRRSIEVSLLPVEKLPAVKTAKSAKRTPVARVLKRRQRRG